MLFITAKNSSGKNLVFLGTVLVTLALQLQGLHRKDAGFAMCWLCCVLALPCAGFAVFAGTGVLQLRMSGSSGLRQAQCICHRAQGLLSSPALTCQNSRGLWPQHIKGHLHQAPHFRGQAQPHHHTQDAHSLMATAYTANCSIGPRC